MYAHVYQGQHNYSKHPFFPIGMEAMVHNKPHKRRTFVQHYKKGYVLGTSFEHYQCQMIWMTLSHARRTSGAVWFKHKYLTNPPVTPVDHITAAIGGLAKTLTTGIPPNCTMKPWTSYAIYKTSLHRKLLTSTIITTTATTTSG